MTKIPTKYVSLHNHTNSSSFDGLGLPEQHFEFCIENGLDAHAVTEHGHMNSQAHCQLWTDSYNKKHDVKFKYIPGVEAYFHPDLNQWKRDKELAEQAKEDKKVAKKLQKQQESIKTKLIVNTDNDDEVDDIEMTNALTIENEDMSKSTKLFNPVNRRHHLVLLPKNSVGLQKINSLVSKSYISGFYRFPRMDSNDLRTIIKGEDVITSSACVGGMVAFNVFQLLQGIEFDQLHQSLLDDKSLLDKCMFAVGNYFDLMEDCVGKGNNYLELQFNRLPAQNLVNRAILEFAKRNGLQDKLIVTCDAHYYRPEVWRERELYKKLGFMNYTDYGPESLPKSKADLKCELYPKNAVQIWQEYLTSKTDTTFYEDDVICDAIERTYGIAHDLLGDVKVDTGAKYPTKMLVPENKTSFQYLIELCIEGLKKRGLADDKRYVDRLHYELGIIKKLDNADYFVTYQKIIELAHRVVLLGPGRGSGGGSLINYVLSITNLDPIKFDLPFERFMNPYRVGAPDIDTDVSDRDALLEELRKFFGVENVAAISNYNTFKVKTLTKDISKFYGIPFEEANEATKTVEQDVRKATLKAGDDKNLFTLTYEEAMQYSPSFKAFIDKYPQVGETMTILFRQAKSLGRHAGGVVICDDLPTKLPLITSGGEIQTPWVEGTQYKHLEKVGNFLKQDVLGLSTLRLLERVIQMYLDDDNLFEMNIEGQTYRYPKGTQIKLSSGEFKCIETCTCEDDVLLPIQTN